MNYTPEDKAKWEKVIQMMEETLTKSGQRPFFDTFIRPLKLYAIASDTMYISGDNAFNILHVQNRFATMIYSTVPLVFGRRYELEYYTEAEIARVVGQIRQNTLNPMYTFDNFIIGASNNFAFAASLAVAQTPGEVYNPLFIYGGVGLGKTHLMNAIGNYISTQDNHLNVLLMTSETMTNELIEGIARKKTSELRNRLRNVDVLMVDDIQFLSRTKATQEEFFHTFNDLYANNKQIIISSDKPPRDLAPMEDRLISRFESGLTVDIQPPDYETRVAILRKKEELDGINIDNEIIQYIAANIKSNIRELEGALNNVVAGSKLGNREITLAMAQEVLRDRIDPNAKREITPDLILRVVADHFGVSVQDLMGQKRNKEIVYPRQLAMYLCRDLTQTPLQQIGQILGGRDHTTVIHGLEKISTELKLKPELEHTVSVLRKKISIQ